MLVFGLDSLKFLKVDLRVVSFCVRFAKAGCFGIELCFIVLVLSFAGLDQFSSVGGAVLLLGGRLSYSSSPEALTLCFGARAADFRSFPARN